MKIIGLTGGIGSGKSTVLKMFQELGVVAYIADIEAKKLMHSNKELVKQIKSLIGEKAYLNNELDRKYIASVVFNDTKKLKQLNALIHPKVKEHFKNFINSTSADFVMYEAAILFESGSDQFCDYTITVTADFEDKLNRVIKRDGMSKEAVLERMKNQMADELKIEKSDFVIRNTNLESTRKQVETLFDLLLKLDDK